MVGHLDIVVVGADDVARLLPIDVAVETQRRAFRQLSAGAAVAPERLLLPGADDSVAFCYAARLDESSAAVCKFGSVNATNAALGLPSVSATILALDPLTGLPSCLIDGTSVTTRRTAAASAAAVSELATPGASVLGVVGSGVQAEAHVHALAHVRQLSEVRIFGIEAEACRALCERLAGDLGLPVVPAGAAEDAVRGADIVLTCTTSSTPVIDDAWIGAGTTVVTIGSFAPDRSETPVELVARADLLVVDHAATATEHAGNLRAAEQAGAISFDDLVEIGQILNGDRSGRTDDDQVIVYSSVGVGIQDAAAAEAIATAARAAEEPTTITLV